ncbi:MAG: rhomboid family intramembrane serine protease [Saprospiraceae bacterium]|nr:rhomboid family intramembrane serine protease [Saprospiraceae bacterium]MBK8819693.1 rhomboid family intramembrane serine protease [Saprospiraceae bacterium]
MEDQWHIKSFFKKIRFPLIILVLLWGIEVYEVLFDKNFMFYGIYPRDFGSLPYIFTAPFIHSDWNHLFSNSAPILVLMSIMALFYPRVATLSYLIILSTTGFLVWLLARGNSYHIGASGVVYGLVSFVFWTGIFRKNIKSIILALIMVIMYSGMFQNLFPTEEVNISWESHLMGGIVGLITAFIFKNVKEPDELEKTNIWENDASKHFFLPRDIFQKTKQERAMEEMENGI